jgi:hypothetical protein
MVDGKSLHTENDQAMFSSFFYKYYDLGIEINRLLCSVDLSFPIPA